MSTNELQSQVVLALTTVAPEIESSTFDADASLRDQVDLDSMDFLRFIVELHTRVGVDIPEADYGRLTSVRAIAEYLQSRVSPG
jgi:acyl carrier protein